MSAHVDDGDLMRLVDGECSVEEQARLEAHVTACQPCAARRDHLARVSAAVTAAFSTDSVSARPQTRAPRLGRGGGRRWHVAALRAAAVLLAVGAVAASAQPVRAWFAARWTDVRRLISPSAAPPHGELPPAATVRFVPTASVFTIEVVARQEEPGGVLTIELSGDTVATATVTSGTRGEELIVLPAGLRIINQPGGSASYDVRLPRGVTEVRLRIAGAPERRLVLVPPARQWSVDLHTTTVLTP